jgi:hypothetical protein
VSKNTERGYCGDVCPEMGVLGVVRLPGVTGGR